MVLDGLLTDAKFGGDLFVKIALGDIMEYLRLSGGQRGYKGFGFGPPGKLLELLKYVFRHFGPVGQAL